MTSKPALQKILKGILYREKEDKFNHKNMGKINLSRQANKQVRIREESNTTKITK
jgi:hypothetical protein